MSEFKNGETVKDLYWGKSVYVADHPSDPSLAIIVNSYDVPAIVCKAPLVKVREPVRVEGWVNVYRDEFGPCYQHLHKTFDDAHQAGTHYGANFLCSIRVTGTEEL